MYIWLAELDTDDKKGEAARAATAERLALKRAAMQELFTDKALELAAAVDPDEPATARFMLAACQAASKALELAGLLRITDPSRMSLAEVEGWIAELEAVHGKQSPFAAQHAALDREMERVMDEVERKVRAEMYAEIDQALAEAEHGDGAQSARRAQVMREVVSRGIDEPDNGNHPPDAA